MQQKVTALETLAQDLEEERVGKLINVFAFVAVCVHTTAGIFALFYNITAYTHTHTHVLTALCPGLLR